MDTIKLANLNDLAKKMKMNKSKLSYYSKMELIIPTNIVGRMMLFDETKTIETIKKIVNLQKKGLSICDIKEKINEK